MRESITKRQRLFPQIKLKNLKFLILREGHSGLRQFDLSGKAAFWGLIALLILTPIVFYFGSQLLLETAYAHRVAKLRKDNATLHRLVERFEDRITVLQREVEALSETDQDLRVHAQMPDINPGIRQVGIGGTMVEVRTDMDYLLPSSDVSLASITERLDALYRSVKLEQLSYEGIRDSLKNDLARLRSTPSLLPVQNGKLTSGFGLRRDPYTQKYDFHRGQDIKVRTGTPVFATANGKVVAARWDSNMGLYVKIDHGNGFRTLYGHLRRIGVLEGQLIERGDRIGESGNTGRSTNPHLHYEVRLYRQSQNPINFY
ncbi:MAG: M23 family metallopeptidase [Fidelibacterota bacterium]|nr:MAG: M23 family metallopeptidase [Candidatus Neomarinimicrobiota bacterium]